MLKSLLRAPLWVLTCKTIFHDDIIEEGSEYSFNLTFDTSLELLGVYFWHPQC